MYKKQKTPFIGLTLYMNPTGASLPKYEFKAKINIASTSENQSGGFWQSQRDAIQTEYIELQQKERNLVDELNAKYGIGSLDPETGIFTPSN